MKINLKKVVTQITAIAVIFWSLGPGVFIALPASGAAFQQPPTIDIMSLINPNETIIPGTLKAVAGINITPSTASNFNFLRIGMVPGNGFDPVRDLGALTNDVNSSLALYMDNKTAGNVGGFDPPNDSVVNLAAAPNFAVSTNLSKLTVPGNQTAPTGGADTITFNLGDLVFANTTTNSDTTDGYHRYGYGWHIVTSDGMVQGSGNANLRFDGYTASQPAFVSGSRISKLAPAATIKTDGTTTGGGKLAVNQGDLVYTKIPGLPTYSWHIVDVAGDLSDDATENTARLFPQTQDPAIASGATISKIIPSGSVMDNGATNGGTLNVTVGDIVFFDQGFATVDRIEGGGAQGVFSSDQGECTAIVFGLFTGGTQSTCYPAQTANQPLAKISTVGGTWQIATAPVTDANLALSTGDIAYGLVTKNPITTGFNWLMVTTGAQGVSNAALRINDATTGAPVYGMTSFFLPNPTPAASTSFIDGPDFFLVMKTAPKASPGKSVSFVVTPRDVMSTNYSPTSLPTTFESNVISIIGDNPIVSDASFGGAKLKQGGNSAAIASIQFRSADNAALLQSIALTFAGTAGTPTWTQTNVASSELADLATTNGGVQLWKETNTTAGFQSSGAMPDTQVTLAANPVYGANGAFTVAPANPPLLAANDTYYVVLKPDAAGVTNGNKFTLAIGGTSIMTSGTASPINAFVSPPVSIDATVPTILTAFAQPDPNTGLLKEIAIFFSEQMLVSSLTCAVATASPCTAKYTVNDPITGDITVTSAAPMSMGNSSDGVRLTLASVAVNGSTTVTPAANQLFDLAGDVVVSQATVLRQAFPPFIKGARRVDAQNIAVRFSNDMKSTTTNVTARYTVTTTANDNEAITSATLGADLRTVTLNLAGAVIANGDTLIINGVENFQDIAGATAQGQPVFQIDGVKPRVVGAVKEDNPSGNDFVYLRFSEPIDRSVAETAANYTPNAGSITAAQVLFYNTATSPSWMTPEMSDRIVKLTTPNVAAITNTVTALTNITDRAGNAMDTAANGNIASFAALANIAISDAGITTDPTKGSFSTFYEGCVGNFDGPNKTGFHPGNGCVTDTNDENRDRIIIPFTGSIDTAAIGKDANGLIRNIGSFIEFFERNNYVGSATTCKLGDSFDANLNQCVQKFRGNLGTSYARVINTEANNFQDNTNNITDDVLVIYLQGETMLTERMEVNPVNILGLNGKGAQQNATAAKNKISAYVFPSIEFVKTNKGNGNAAIIDGGDTVTFFFSADMNRTAIADINALPNILRPVSPSSQYRLWGGDGLAIAWGNHNGTTCTAGGTNSDGIKDCLIVTRGATITVGTFSTLNENDLIRVQNLSTATGQPLDFAFDLKVDTLAPGATAVMNAATNIVAITFSEELRENDGTLGNYADNVTYNGAGGATNAARDATYNQDGFTAGIQVSNEALGPTPTQGGSIKRIKKLLIKLTAAPEAADVISFTNLVDGAGLGVANSNPSADAVAPTICRIKFRDDNNDGKLSAIEGFEIEFDNETPANPANGCVSDIDSSTLTDPNIDFLIKRSGATVGNAFGPGAKMFPMFNGGLSMILGMGADIRAGDEIWAVANQIKDFTGNAMNAGAAQYTIANLVGGEITKVIFTNLDGNPAITHGDTIKIVFNAAINIANPNLPLRDNGSGVIGNLDEGLWLDHNFEENSGTNTAFTAKKSWGKNSTGAWGNGNTELTITLNCASGASPTVCDANTNDAQFGNKDQINLHYEVVTIVGSHVRGKTIDLTAPQLFKVFGNRGMAGATATWDAGDKVVFLFNEPMDAATLTTNNLTTLANELNPGADGSINFGTGATALFLDPEKRVLEVTLGANTTVADTSAFNPDASVKDSNGAGDGTPANIVLAVTTLPPVANLAVQDNDTTNPGIDGRDLKVSWDVAQGATQYKVYVVPIHVQFDPLLHGPIAIPTSSICTQTTCTFTGPETQKVDSRSMTAAGSLDETKRHFFFGEFEEYVVFVMASTAMEDSFPARLITPFRFTEEYGNDGQDPKVSATDPQNGTKEISTNHKQFSVTFNEAMRRTSVEGAGNIKLQKKVGENWTDVPVFVAYDGVRLTATVEAQANLDVNTNYRIIVSTAVTDIGGAPFAAQYETYFSTGAFTDSTSPKVETYFFDDTTLSTLTAVDRATRTLSIKLDESLDPAFVTTANVTLSPSITGSKVVYNSSERTIEFTFGSHLEAGVAYSLTLSGTELRDLAGNKLDGDKNGSASGATSDNYTLSFTASGAALSTTKPTIRWVDSDTKTIRIGFSDKMDIDVTNKAKWSLSPATADLRTATFKYINDLQRNELFIEGVSGLTSGVPYTLVPDPSLLGLNGQPIDVAGSTLTVTPQSKTQIYNKALLENAVRAFSATSAFNGDLFNKMGNEDFANDRQIQKFTPVIFQPRSPLAGKRTNYFISFPTTKAIPNGGKIILEFPATFDLSQAAMAKDKNNILPPHNQDINKDNGTLTGGTIPNQSGKVQVASVVVNSKKKTVTLTLAVDDGTGCTLDLVGDDETPVINGTQNAVDNTVYGEFKSNCTNTNQNSTTNPGDFFEFELSGIKNGEAAEIDWKNGRATGGYTIKYSTQDSASRSLEGPFERRNIAILKGGSGSISGTVTAADGTTPIANARVKLHSDGGGFDEVFTGNDGKYSFTQLAVSESNYVWDGTYEVNIEAPEGNDTFFGQRTIRDIRLTPTAPSVSGKNAKLDSAEHTVTFTITFDANLTNKDIFIGFNGNLPGKEKRVTLTDTDGNPGNGLAVTNATLKVPTGSWSFTARPYVEDNGYGMTHEEQNFRLTAAQKYVSAATAVSLTLTKPTNILSGTVKDQNGKGLPNVSVFALGFTAKTTTDGSYAFEVPSGSFSVSVYKSGLKRAPDKFVEVQNGNVSSVDFVMGVPPQSISGTVTGRDNVALNDVVVSAYSSALDDVIETRTDNMGFYTIPLDPSSWTISAFTETEQIPLSTGALSESVAVAASQNITDKNFSLAALSTSQYVTIEGQVRDLSNNPISNAFVFYERVSFVNGVAGEAEANSSVTTDDSGNYSFTVKKSTTGTALGATRYVFRAFIKGNEVKPDVDNFYDIQANTNNITFSVPTIRKMKVSIINGDQLEKGAVDISQASVSLKSTNIVKSAKGMFRSVDLTNGANAAVGEVSALQGGGYTATLDISGVGTFSGTVGGSSTFAITNDATVQFDLALNAANSVVTMSGTTKDALGAVVTGAGIEVVNAATNRKVGTFNSDGNGIYSIKVPAGQNYKLQANKRRYSASEAVTASANDANRTLTLTSSLSTIAAQVKLNGVVSTGAYVWAEQVGGTGREYASFDAQTNIHSLSVPASTNWKLFASDSSGNQGVTPTAIAAGSSNIVVNLTTAIAGKEKLTLTPTLKSLIPEKGGIVDDSDKSGIRAEFPAGALSSSASQGTLSLKETAAAPTDNLNKPLGGVAKEISFVDSAGNEIKELTGDVTYTFVYKKDEMEPLGSADNTKASNGLEELNLIQNSYLDEVTQSYVPLPTTKTACVKNQSTDANCKEVDFAIFTTNVTGEGINPNGGGTQKDYYADYEISLTSQVNHHTIFASIVPTDVTAPAAPSGLSVSAASGRASLTWTQNTEADLLEYEIYRGTASDFVCSNATQINTTSTGKVGSFNDTGVGTASYSFFYKISAADTSGNESACSGAIVANFTAGGGTGSGGGSSGGAVITSASGSTATSASTSTTSSANTSKKTEAVVETAKPSTSGKPCDPGLPMSWQTDCTEKKDVTTEKKDSVKPTTKTEAKAAPKSAPKAAERKEATKAMPTVQATKAALSKLPSLTRPLFNGSSGADVKTLQEVLKAQGYYAGEITGVVDAATIEAIKKLQMTRKLAEPGQRGYGTIGPATRAAVNAILKEAGEKPSAPAQEAAKPTAIQDAKQASSAVAPSMSDKERLEKETKEREAQYAQVITEKTALVEKYASESGELKLPAERITKKAEFAKAALVAEELVAKITSVLIAAPVREMLKEALTDLPEPVKKAGAGQFAAAMNSTRKVNNGQVPEDAVKLGEFIQNAMLLAVGRFHMDAYDNPKAESETAELLSVLYKRKMDPSKRSADAVAIEIATYGLQPTRDAKKEAFCVPVVEKAYGQKLEKGSAQYWDIVRACAYSGASR